MWSTCRRCAWSVRGSGTGILLTESEGMAVEAVAVRSKSPMVKVLLAMSRSPESQDYAMSHVDYDQARALDTMREVFPTIDKDIQGKRVIDFGCGKGYQAVGYALAGAESVVGVEIIDSLVEQSR